MFLFMFFFPLSLPIGFPFFIQLKHWFIRSNVCIFVLSVSDLRVTFHWMDRIGMYMYVEQPCCLPMSLPLLLLVFVFFNMYQKYFYFLFLSANVSYWFCYNAIGRDLNPSVSPLPCSFNHQSNLMTPMCQKFLNRTCTLEWQTCSS